MGWTRRKGSADPVALRPDLAELKWSAKAGTYELALPDIGSGRLPYTFPGNNQLAFSLVDPAGNKFPVAVTVDPGEYYAPRFTAVGLLYWQPLDSVPKGQLSEGQAVFGLPSTSADLPAAGIVRYSTLREPGGDAQLSFDFSNGRLTGSIGIALWDDWGPYEPIRYELSQVDYGRGRTSFSAHFAIAGAPSDGMVMGQLMGKGAAELAVWWEGWIRNPYAEGWIHASGVWVGRPVAP
jgi:hypothetical protein